MGYEENDRSITFVNLDHQSVITLYLTILFIAIDAV